MKRLTAILFLCLAFLVEVSAETVSEQTALQVARRFFGAYATKGTPDELTVVWDGRQGYTKAVSAAPFYVIARKSGGFVIVAGDDNVIPVLGFSLENSFSPENMPDNVAFMMNQMRIWCESHTKQSAETKAGWDEYETEDSIAADKVSNEYLGSRTVEWRQDSPFNAKAPLLASSDTGNSETGDHGDGIRCAAGCIPVALAEIMAWHGAPSKGDGAELPIYRYKDSKTETYGKNVLNTTYDWAGIRKIKTVEDTISVKSDVLENMAKLILDCGTLVEATYGSSTGAMETDIIEPFIDHMGFSSNAELLYAKKYDESEWEEYLIDEISKRPVPYFGETQTSGHAFVADGYATYKRAYYFHFNFGWGSSYNGYYHTFSHPVAGTKDYQYNQSAIFDFYPVNDTPGDDTICLLPTSKDSTGLRIVSKTPVEKGQTVEVAYYYLSFEFPSYKGKIRLCLEDRDGNIKQVINTSANVDWDDRHYWSSEKIDANGKKGVITEDIELGDKITLYYSKTSNAGTFEKVLFTEDGSIVGEAPCVPVTFIRTDNHYKAGDRFELRLVNNRTPYNNETFYTTWTVVSPSGESATYDTSERYIYLDGRGVWKITATIMNNSNGETVESIHTNLTAE